MYIVLISRYQATMFDFMSILNMLFTFALTSNYHMFWEFRNQVYAHELCGYDLHVSVRTAGAVGAHLAASSQVHHCLHISSQPH